MKRVALLTVVVAGCGGDDSNARPDVLINPGPTYDLSCLGNMKTVVPTTITLETVLSDFTTNVAAPITTGTITAFTLADDAQVGTVTLDTEGKGMLEITTSGTATRLVYEADATGFVPSRTMASIAPWKDAMASFPMAKQSRLDDIATALSATIDPTKGVLEVWANDCSSLGELPGATLQLDGADVQWAMYGGVGVWIPRAMTLGTVPQLRNGSVAGIINVTPGTHTVRIQAGSLDMSTTVNVEAGAWNVLITTPGHPLN